MTEDNRTYIAIDLKSFFASVECVERGLDPLNTNLVVADVSRTEKTICLAVSPSLTALGYVLLRLQRDHHLYELQNSDIQFLHIKLYTLPIIYIFSVCQLFLF